MPKSRRVLRQRLQNILTEESYRLQEAKIVQLASKFDSAFIELVHHQSEKKHLFNCFMHVLNLIDRVQPNVIKQNENTLRFFVDSVFFLKLYDAGILSEISFDQLEPKDFVVYYNGQEKRHVVLYSRPNRVESKWGGGPLFRHGLWDVPKSYGDALRYFKSPEQARVDAFLRVTLPMVSLSVV